MESEARQEFSRGKGMKFIYAYASTVFAVPQYPHSCEYLGELTSETKLRTNVEAYSQPLLIGYNNKG